MTPLFLAPLRLEARAARRGRPGLEVQQIGMGPVRATAARTRVTSEQPPGRPIVLIGFGGGLVPDLAPGTLVVAQSISGLDGDEVVTLPDAPGVAELLAQAGLEPVLAPHVSSPAILNGDEARAKAARRGAVCVDMEALWCVPLARRHPFVVVRALVDVPGRELRSLATPAAAWKAFRVLSAAARALATWSPSTVNEYPLLEVGDS